MTIADARRALVLVALALAGCAAPEPTPAPPPPRAQTAPVASAAPVDPFEARCAAALEAARAGDKGPLRELVAEVELDDGVDEGGPDIQRFRADARAALGDKDYDRTVAKAEMARFDADSADLDAGPPPPPQAPELRGNEARRAAMREATKGAELNLANARKTLERQRAARRARVEAEAARAIESVAKGPLKHAGQTLGLRAYDETGFTVVVDGREVRHGWGGGPPELCHDVRFRAIDTTDPQAVFDLGLYACRRLLFADAGRHFARAVQLRPELRPWVPDLEELKQHTRLFRGKSALGRPGDRSTVSWSFAEPRELLDLEVQAEGMRRDLTGGLLQVGSDLHRLSLAKLRGEWDGTATLGVTLASAQPPHLVAVTSPSSILCVELGRTIRLVDLAAFDDPPLAEGALRAAPGARVTVEATVENDALTLRVTVGGEVAFSQIAPWDGPIAFALGGLGQGDARFDDLTVEGLLSPGWERRTKGGAEGEVARALERLTRPDERPRDATLPYAYAPTSAEDPVALEGIDPRWVDLLAEGRGHLAQGDLGQALECFRQAADGAPDLHAAAYLASVASREPDLALVRLERAIAGVEDFYEARAARAVALASLGRLTEAQAEVDQALALRPDFPPAHVARARLLTLREEYSEALAALELADLLGPGDPYTRQALGVARALVEGPSWAERARVTTPRYQLDTDLVAEADRLARRLDGIGVRYAEAFPTLVNPLAPPRPAPVLLFSSAEDYRSYSERTSGDRSEDTLGHFDATTGQLLVLLDAESDDPGALHVLYHEGLHQWLHRQGVALPFWAAEGLAEYVGGTELAADGSIVSRGVVDSFLVARLRSLRDWSGERLRFADLMCQSPAEFYAGDASFKYAQAWAMAHFFLEGGERASVAGRERPLRDLFVNYLERFRTSAPWETAGSRLEYVYVATFHQLDDLPAVEQKFSEYVVALARRHGVELR